MDRRAFLRTGGAAAAGALLGGCPASCTADTVTVNRAPQRRSAPPQRKLQVLSLKGTPRERGRAHGEALRATIRPLVKRWKAELGFGDVKQPDDYIETFLRRTRFPDAIRRWTPDLLSEVEGLAEGAGIDRQTMFAFQLLDEQWMYALHRQYKIPLPAPLSARESPGCSVLGVPGLVAQTMDLPTLYDDGQVVLMIDEGGHQTAVFTCAGLIALTGCNDAGVGVVVKAVMELDHSVNGLPVAFIVRGLLQRRSQAEAVGLLKQVQHAAAQTYTVGSPGVVGCYECSSRSVVRFAPQGEKGRVWHTNHALANQDRANWSALVKKMPPKGPPDPAMPSSRARFRALKRRLKGGGPSLRLDEVKAVLASRDDPALPVCRPRADKAYGTMTFGSAVMQLRDRVVMHVAAGPPCEGTYEVFKVG